MWKIKLTAASIGALFILLGMYFFPFGQDIVMLQLTLITGSQVTAWSVMYVICFALIFGGLAMGGAAFLGMKRLSGMFKMLLTNPLGLIAILVIMFIIYLQVAQMFGGI